LTTKPQYDPEDEEEDDELEWGEDEVVRIEKEEEREDKFEVDFPYVPGDPFW